MVTTYLATSAGARGLGGAVTKNFSVDASVTAKPSQKAWMKLLNGLSSTGLLRYSEGTPTGSGGLDGSICVDMTNRKLYVRTASSTWTEITTA